MVTVLTLLGGISSLVLLIILGSVAAPVIIIGAL